MLSTALECLVRFLNLFWLPKFANYVTSALYCPSYHELCLVS
jgi:hypothetical protein